MNQLLQQSTPSLGKLFHEVGTSEPATQSFSEELSIPPNYNIQGEEVLYAESSQPIYNLQVSKELHAEEVDDEEEDTQLITTQVINNPVPKDYTEASLEMLDLIRTF